jgi:Polyketide cyclase / dehydrase and lipid transport
MSRPGSLEVEARSAAPVERVWALLEDGTTWSDWARFTHSSYEREGEGRHGIGAIRSFGTGPVRTREEVVAHDAPDHLGYRLLSGLPVKGYRADVRLAADGDGTRITWASSWGSAPPGMAWFLRRTVGGVARSLARGAEASR